MTTGPCGHLEISRIICVTILCGGVNRSFHAAVAQFAYPGNKWRARVWFVTHRQAAIARGHGHSLHTPETNNVLAVVCEPSSVSVNITRPDWLNTHTLPALIMPKVSPSFYQRWNDAALFREMRETTSPINGNAMESAERHQWMSLLTSRCQHSQRTMQRCRLSE